MHDALYASCITSSQERESVRTVKILERILAAIPIMLGVAVLVFLFMRLTPGDPVDIMMGQGGAVSAGEMEQLRHEFHLDEPLYVQLWLFLKGRNHPHRRTPAGYH